MILFDPFFLIMACESFIFHSHQHAHQLHARQKFVVHMVFSRATAQFAIRVLTVANSGWIVEYNAVKLLQHRSELGCVSWHDYFAKIVISIEVSAPSIEITRGACMLRYSLGFFSGLCRPSNSCLILAQSWSAWLANQVFFTPRPHGK